MKKQWKLDNKGMTLLEVIVAFAIFAIAATILITGFNGALKVMGNSEAIKDASQGNASGLEISGSPLDAIEGVTVEILEGDPDRISFGSYSISGVFRTATSNKKNDGMEMSLKMFEPDTKVLVTPTVPTPEPTTPKPTPDDPDAPPYSEKTGTADNIFKNSGGFTGEVMDGEFGIGVIEKTVNFNQNSGKTSYEYILRQLLFLADPPFRYNNANMIFDLDFLEIDNGFSYDSTSSEALYIKNQYSPQKKNRGNILVYFKEDILIKDSKKKREDISIASGYYLVKVPEGKADTGIDIVRTKSVDWLNWKVAENEFNEIYSSYVTDLWK